MARRTGLRDMIKGIAPPWLQTGVGEKFLYVMGLVTDALLDKMNQGMRLHLPGYGDASALATLALDRLIVQGFQETPTAYANRLKKWLDSHQREGSATAVLAQLAGFVSPTVLTMRTVSDNGVWDTSSDGATVWHYRSNPDNWDWDSLCKFPQGLWWRFWTIIYAGSLWTNEGTWGDGQKWGDGGTWGSTMTQSQVQTIQAIVRQWKAAHNIQGPIGHHAGIIVSFDATWFSPFASPGGSIPDGNWGKWAKVVANVYVASRTANAIYIDAPLPNAVTPPNGVTT